MKLLLDEHHDPEVARHLRERGHDVAAVADRDDLRGRPDTDIFAAAEAEGRTVVTEDVRDYAGLVMRAAEVDQGHPGVIFTAPARYPRVPDARARLIDALARFLDGHPAPDALRDTVVWL